MAEVRQAAERDDEHLLHQILELTAIAEHPEQVGGDDAAEPVVQLVLGGAVVRLAARHQLALVERLQRTVTGPGRSGRVAGVLGHDREHSAAGFGSWCPEAAPRFKPLPEPPPMDEGHEGHGH